MEAKDLRIGNWVHNDEVGEFQCNADTISFLEKEPFKNILNPIEAIPLSEQWLKRFGAASAFPNDPQNNVLQLGELAMLLQSEGNLFVQVDFNEAEGMTIKYVHQLQNLYHALTGHELNIEESR